MCVYVEMNTSPEPSLIPLPFPPFAFSPIISDDADGILMGTVG